jgi:hypothetical protein
MRSSAANLPAPSILHHTLSLIEKVHQNSMGAARVYSNSNMCLFVAQVEHTTLNAHLQGEFHRAAGMQSRRIALVSRPFIGAHEQFALNVEPVHQFHKTAVCTFFEEGRKAFRASNPASKATLMAREDRPSSLHNLFRYLNVYY